MTKKELKQMFFVLMFCQWIFMLYAIFCFIYWWDYGHFGAIIMSGVGVYASMFFHGFIVHFNKHYAEDLKAAFERDMYEGLTRRQRRSFLRKIFKKK